LKYLITQSSDIGGLVLDPFAGSGATLAAATFTGRSSLGFELNEERFLSAQRYLESAVDDTTSAKKPTEADESDES